MDKNKLASQQRGGRKARILLSSAPIVHEELKTSTLIASDFLVRRFAMLMINLSPQKLTECHKVHVIEVSSNSGECLHYL